MPPLGPQLRQVDTASVDTGGAVGNPRFAGAVVAVRSEACGTRTTASGFLIDGLIVTNAHVVHGAGSVLVVAPDWGGSVSVARRADGLDLAVAATGVAGGFAWAEHDAAVGEEVSLVARVDGVVESVPARVQAYSEPGGYGGAGPAMLLDPAGRPGFSGGPVVDADGRVVGVMRAIDAATGLTVAEPLSVVRAWLQRDNYGDSPTSCDE